MIVEPGFLDNWRTRLLESTLKDPLGHTYILRLWAHCQERKAYVFDIDKKALASICMYNGDENILYDALQKSNYIVQKKRGIYIRNWEKVNHTLVTSWRNRRYGKLGGRPRKTPGVSPDNPRGSLQKPEKRREEKRRIEKNSLASRARDSRTDSPAIADAIVSGQPDDQTLPIPTSQQEIERFLRGAPGFVIHADHVVPFATEFFLKHSPAWKINGKPVRHWQRLCKKSYQFWLQDNAEAIYAGNVARDRAANTPSPARGSVRSAAPRSFAEAIPQIASPDTVRREAEKAKRAIEEASGE